MCGIAGFVSKQYNEGHLHKMTEILHKGLKQTIDWIQTHDETH
jgi:hypothetical protein